MHQTSQKFTYPLYEETVEQQNMKDDAERMMMKKRRKTKE